jgi:TolB-like protein/DNA-binding winged helix-turn-helix (wHTH) protein/tetratricopeptide (TPR) repeat protein
VSGLYNRSPMSEATQREPRGTVRFGAYELSPERGVLFHKGVALKLQPQPLRALAFLIDRAPEIVSREALADHIWGDGVHVDIEQSLNYCIRQIRQVLDDRPSEPKFVETLPRQGYRFIATVTQEPSAGDPASATDPKAVSGSVPPSSAGMPRAGRPGTGILKLKWLLLAAGLSLAAILGLWSRHRLGQAEEPIRSLAVLPLDDLSPGTREDYFADGMTDELITELARIPGLRVVSRTSVIKDKGARKSLAQIARELNVDAIVEGSVVRSGDRVRITAQLIDARSDKHLWAQSFVGPLGDILSLQDSVAREIALQTRSVLTPAARAGLTNPRHVNPEAHDAYLRGLYFIQRREGDVAASYFRKALALEPEYAAANAGLAEALVTQFVVDGASSAVLMPSAIEAAGRAIELDPYSGEAYTALGAIDTTYLYHWNAAEKNLRKGIELSPSSSDAETWYAVYLTSVGRPAEAVNAMRRAVALDPLSFWANRLLGSMLYYSRRYDESLVALKSASELAPDKFGFVEGWNSSNYELLGLYNDAFAADMKVLASELSSGDIQAFRSAFETRGWKGYQETRLKYLQSRSLSNCYMSMNSLAMSYLRLGNIAEAFRRLSRDLDNRCGTTVFDLSADPRLDKIREDPRFAALLHRANLPQ